MPYRSSLKFRVLEEPKPLANKFWSAFPQGKDRGNLDRWWEFEQKDPDTFQDLYKISRQKVPN